MTYNYKSSNPSVEELALAISDLKDVSAGREFLKAFNPLVRPFGKLDIVYRDRARVVLHALIEAELLGTLNQSAK